MLPRRRTSLALPGSASEPTTTGWVRSETLTTCSPEAPAATKAKPPLTSTALAKPGIGTKDSETGAKVLTIPVACAEKPLLVTVMVQAPLLPEKTFPSGLPKLQMVRSLDE